MDADRTQEHLRIGKVAGLAHVSARTLHHYEAVGLLQPSRSESGYRLYAEADVARLYRILALRSLGLPLEEIGGCSTRTWGMVDVLGRQLAAIERRMAADADLQRRLRALLAACAAHGEPTLTQITDTMEAMATAERHYTPEQLQALAERRQALGSDGMRATEQAWADLIAQAEAERAAGTDPAAPGMQALAGRWRELIEQFTGGDPGIRESLGRMYRDEGVERASRGGVSGELMAYVGQALAVRRE